MLAAGRSARYFSATGSSREGAITGPLISEKSPGCQFVSCRRRQQARILALNLPQYLDIAEEESLVLDDVPADAAAELVLPEFRAADTRGVRKEVVGVQFVVSEILVHSAVVRVGARLGDKIDHRAARPSYFGRVAVGVYLHFLDRVDRRPV